MMVKCYKEFELSDGLNLRLNNLLQDAFEGYPKKRNFIHQVPSFRFLYFDEDELIGHAAIDHRRIHVGTESVMIWGITDFCMSSGERRKGLGKKLMRKIMKKAKTAHIPFLALLSDESPFYIGLGFIQKDVRARWVMIHEERLFGIQERTMKNTLNILSLSSSKWPEGPVDFMGPLF